mmetsp:Transcript_47623/g.111391  ORF Transcript_47623/g.111391 Transcript_47623/m.111391 type:complete len:329 (+) Transcript_47623:67-1053(+)
MSGSLRVLASCYFLTGCLCLAAEESSVPGTCLLQKKVEQRQREGSGKQIRQSWPWDFHTFLVVGFHKSGVQMTWAIFRAVWGALGLGHDRVGHWGNPCYFPDFCYNWGSPVRFVTDMYSLEMHERELQRAGQLRTLRVAGSVRNPLVMIASAYCYHHRGQEDTNVMFYPKGTVQSLGPEDGVAFVAQRMMVLMDNMTAFYETPRNDTLRLSFEQADGSSEGFDQEVGRLLDFWFEGVPLHPDDRRRALEAARQGDLHRHPYPGHTNDDACMQVAQHAVFSMPADLLSIYQSYAKRLGYPYTEELLPQRAALAPSNMGPFENPVKVRTE